MHVLGVGHNGPEGCLCTPKILEPGVEKEWSLLRCPEIKFRDTAFLGRSNLHRTRSYSSSRQRGPVLWRFPSHLFPLPPPSLTSSRHHRLHYTVAGHENGDTHRGCNCQSCPGPIARVPCRRRKCSPPLRPMLSPLSSTSALQ
jgi:hypothetical protein